MTRKRFVKLVMSVSGSRFWANRYANLVRNGWFGSYQIFWDSLEYWRGFE